MAKVLVIRKTDKTIHRVPVQNKAALMAHNNRSKLGWKFEEMDEEEANNLPFIDPNYVTAAEAVKKVDVLEKANAEKDNQIKELQEKLQALQNSGNSASDQATAAEKIEQIKSAQSVEAVDVLLINETRSTVLAAGEKRKKDLESGK